MTKSPSPLRVAFVLAFAAAVALLYWWTNREGTPGAPPSVGHATGDAGTRPAVAPDDPERENPDRGRFLDLRTVPFRKEWVGGTLVVARARPPESLNNLFWSSGEARSYAKYYLYPFLLAEVPDVVDGEIRMEPWAAESLPERRPDGRTFVYRLREGLRWEDGTPVTANDYAFTFELLSDPAVSAGARRAQLERLQAVRAVDARTIEVEYKEPYYNAVANFGLEFTVVPAHAVPRDPAAFNQVDRHLSFGPYRLVESTPQRNLLELRPEYRERPHPVHPHYVERIEIRFVPDPANRLEQLKGGSIHLDTVSHDQFERLGVDPRFTKECWKTSYAMPTYAFCGWNQRDPEDPASGRPHPLFADVRVRRAMSRLFPRERLVREHFHGRATIVTGPYFYKDGDTDPGVAPIPYDLEGARALLAEAGWRQNDAGILEKDGRPFRFQLTIPQLPNPLEPAATLFVESARKVGIEVELRPRGTDLLPTMQSHRFDAVMAINVLLPVIEPDQFELFHSSQAPLEASNWCGVADPRIDRLIEAYRREFDPVKRRASRRALHRVIDEVQPFTFLYAAASGVAVNRRWANVKVHDLGILYRDFVERERFEASPPPGR